MYNLDLIEECYKKYINNLNYWLPDGITFINLELLNHYDLLHFQPLRSKNSPHLTAFFQVIESPEKITLINEEFIIWIVPQHHNQLSTTHTLIAINRDNQEPQLETAFITSGIYNTSPLVLKVLEKILLDIQETEYILSKIKNT